MRRFVVLEVLADITMGFSVLLFFILHCVLFLLALFFSSLHSVRLAS